MASKFSQISTQVQTQTQNLTPQQLLVSQLTEMPVEALYERVDQELKENIALERDNHDDWAEGGIYDSPKENGSDGSDTSGYPSEEDSYAAITQPTYADAVADYGSPDDVPDHLPGSQSVPEEIVGESLSFYDQLDEQIGFLHLNGHEEEVLRYLIGSLDDDGLLHTSLQQIQDELEVYHNVNTSSQELEHLLGLLQTFEPAGVGARSLQECLLLQVRHNEEDDDRLPLIKRQLIQLLDQHFDALMINRWDRIQHSMQLSDKEVKRLQHEVKRLNPRPGSSMGEAIGRNIQQITPDFIVENDPYGNLALTLNQGQVPTLHINDEDLQLLKSYDKRDPKSLSRTEREGVSYLRDRVERARSFIEALRQRHHTLSITMQTIINLQRPFFDSGDETLLRPMNLEDVAKQTGLHISTISRVSNSKWVQTTYGIYPLRWFFTSAARQGGEDVSIRAIKTALKEIIDAEDKQHPFTDEALTKALRQRHFDVARRTVTKYRVQMNIPTAKMRK
ncbi:MAG: RNA polymerase factor sigma-54 [Bacteroidales bacterium]|nr:RNA polymerase factor sigma-54 [Bacteroidales bacterium]